MLKLKGLNKPYSKWAGKDAIIVKYAHNIFVDSEENGGDKTTTYGVLYQSHTDME